MNRGNFSRRRFRSRVTRESRPPEGPSAPSTSRAGRRRSRSKSSNVITAWKRKLPGYSIYYLDSIPQLRDFDNKIDVLADYFLREFKLEDFERIKNLEYFQVQFDKIQNIWPTFHEDLKTEPSEVMSLLGVVMHKVTTELYGKTGKIHAGVYSSDPITRIKDVTSVNLGKYVTIKGQVIRTEPIRPVCLQLPFNCELCESEFLVGQVDGNFTRPRRCGIDNDCYNMLKFEPNVASQNILMMDQRTIKMQDTQDDESQRTAVPPTIKCDLTNGLCIGVTTGQILTVSGIVKMRRGSENKDGGSIKDLFIEVVAIERSKEMEGQWSGFDSRRIEEIKNAPQLLKRLVSSMCPSIFGQEIVKLSILLGLLGGTKESHMRSDINLLLVGDSGLGKSQLLQMAKNLAQNGNYICASNSTVAGLSVSLVPGNDGFSLEGGALLLSDLGTLCIDEFDKLPAPVYPIFLEAMEQQSISIAKAGMCRTLSARVSVIAAGNPVNGRYDATKSFNNNLKISPQLHSRFDLTFVLLDKPDENTDKRISDHILGITSSDSDNSSGPSERELGLMDRVRQEVDDEMNLISQDDLRKYIAYAKQHIFPKLSQEASTILKFYYTQLRERQRRGGTMQITTRQVESLKRLAQARAKVELRHVATAQDARDVVEMFEFGLKSMAIERGSFRGSLRGSFRGTGATGSTSRGQGVASQARKLEAELRNLSSRQNKISFTEREIEAVMESIELSASSEQLITKLNNQGTLLYKGYGIYEFHS